jgi:hypothetical protein
MATQDTKNEAFEPDWNALGEDFTEKPAETPTTEEEGKTNETATEGTEQKTDDTKPTEGSDEQKPADKDSSGNKPDSTKQQGKEEKPEAPLRPGDLRTPEGGIVRAGAERRFYETAQLAKRQLETVNAAHEVTKQQVQQLQSQVQAFQTAATATGALPPEQAIAATRLYSDLARDPLGTVTKLLAELKSKGHTIDGIGSAVDTQAIQLMIKQNQPQPVVNQQDNAEQEAAKEVGIFFSTFPDAVMHDEILGEIITTHPNLSLQDAYFHLRNSVIQRGLDWSKPIKPQLQPQQQQQTNTQQQQQKPMVNGRAPADIVEDKITLTPQAGETFDDIIRAAMQDARS